jgi:hypothetical protein
MSTDRTVYIPRYFKRHEFVCGDENVFDMMDPDFLRKLDLYREAVQRPIKIVSSGRTWTHHVWVYKKNWPGVPPPRGSYHLSGRAIDHECTDSIFRAKCILAALQLGLSVGVMKNSLHIDNRPGEPIVYHYYK